MKKKHQQWIFMTVVQRQPVTQSPFYVSLNQFDPSNLGNFAKLPAYEQIGRIYATALLSVRAGGIEAQSPIFRGALEALGVDATDVERTQLALDVFRAASARNPLIAATKDNNEFDRSGVWSLANPTTNKVELFFKVGHKRLVEENACRTASRLVGMSKYVTSVIPCVLQNPPMDGSNQENETELMVPLWNGRNAAYSTTNPPLMVGGVQRALTKNDPVRPTFSFEALLAGLVFGVRDFKDDGFGKVTSNGEEHMVLFDMDDCFPIAIDPPRFKTPLSMKHKGVAATDMPFLKHPQAAQNLTAVQIAELATLVQTWDPDAFAATLAQEPLSYYDKAAEAVTGQSGSDEEEFGTMLTKDSFSFYDKDEAVNPKGMGTDDNGTSFESVALEKPHLINGVLSVKVGVQKTAFNEKQINAFKKRMERIQEFILSKHENSELFSPLELVCAVDKFFKIYLDATRKIVGTASPVSQARLTQFTPFAMVGRLNPETMGKDLSLTEEQVQALIQEMYNKAVQQKLALPTSDAQGASKPRSSHLEVKTARPEKKTGSPTKPKVKTKMSTSVILHARGVLPSSSKLD